MSLCYICLTVQQIKLLALKRSLHVIKNGYIQNVIAFTMMKTIDAGGHSFKHKNKSSSVTLEYQGPLNTYVLNIPKTIPELRRFHTNVDVLQ